MDVTCLGEALIDFVALETGVSVGDASGFLKAPGGAPANVAVGAARLGLRAAFVGKVGDDPFGRFLEGTLADAGVDVSGMRFDTTARTGLAFVSLRADGERSFAFFRNPSADMLFRPDELDLELIDRSCVFHFGSITLIDEPARSTTLAAADAARRAGCLLSCDPNLRPALWPSLDDARAAIRQALTLADVAKLSDEELAFVTGEPTVALGTAALLDLCPRLALLAVTLGEKGCVTATRDGAFRTYAPRTVTAVDTTGAGDGFVAGMLARLLATAPAGAGGPAVLDGLTTARLDDVFRYANTVGALACTRKGAIPALPTHDAVQAALASDAPDR